MGEQYTFHRRTKFESARSFCSTFTSVGGALLVFIFYLRVVGNISNLPLFIMQFIPTLLGFIRLYWFYSNTLVFFSPFDNIWLFVIDLFAFFTGAIAIGLMGVGNGSLWFLSLSLCLLICFIRTLHVNRKAKSLKKQYPSSYNKVKKGTIIFAKSICITWIACLISWIFLILTYSLLLLYILCMILNLCIIVGMFYWVDEMWPDENDTKRVLIKTQGKNEHI
ncbi:MAG: hypothetical protein ACFFG0_52005 [Candidatus Thorarchaeota archaeon]